MCAFIAPGGRTIGMAYVGDMHHGTNNKQQIYKYEHEHENIQPLLCSLYVVQISQITNIQLWIS